MADTIKDRKRALRDVSASWALEGIRSSPEEQALLNAYADGSISMSRLEAEMDALD